MQLRGRGGSLDPSRSVLFFFVISGGIYYISYIIIYLFGDGPTHPPPTTAAPGPAAMDHYVLCVHPCIMRNGP